MTEARVPEGRRVDLMITGDDGNPLLTSGTVVHCVAKLGIGIRFSNQTDFTIRRLDQLIFAHYAKRLRRDDDAEDTDTGFPVPANLKSQVFRKVDRR